MHVQVSKTQELIEHNFNNDNDEYVNIARQQGTSD